MHARVAMKMFAVTRGGGAADHAASPGKLWEATGQKVLLGYNIHTNRVQLCRGRVGGDERNGFERLADIGDER